MMTYGEHAPLGVDDEQRLTTSQFAVAHPYASASPCSSTSTGTKTRPKRPTIATTSSAPASFLDATSPTCSAKSSPSPITFARASVISPLHDFSENDKEKIKEREKKDRRRGLMAAERVTHAGLDALLRAPEAAPRAAPQPRAPQLVRSATNMSVTPTIERLPCVASKTENENGHESEGSSSSMSTPRASSPAPSSGSGSAPSTPGQPRTPVSVEFEVNFAYPAVAPLSISKANRTPSPAPPAKLHPARAPSPVSKSKEDSNAGLNGRRSRGRFSARTASVARAEQVFAPLELDTAAARSLDLSLESPRGVPTLTGVLAEFERETIPPLPDLPVEEKKKIGEEEDEDESEWLDVEEDPLGDAEYYRADIASHLQLFSPTYSFPPSTTTSSYVRHRRGGSSSSSSSYWQLPPARPDSLPPPPHFLSSLSSPSSAPLLPSLPAFPLLPMPTLPESTHHTSLRRASASSLASTASGRSNRSTGSASGKSKRRSARHSHHSIARRSAAIGVGRKRSGNALGVNRPLPPLPGAARKEQATRPGPSALLDPTYMELASIEQGEERARPPPRFSIPLSVNDEDMFDEDFAVVGMGMGKLAEEDEDEDGMIDPFVLGGLPMIDASGSAVRDEVRADEVDPFTIPMRSARSDVPLSPSSLSSSSSFSLSPYSQPQPFLLVPESPTPSSTHSGSSTDTFDAESLYSSYASFNPGPDSSSISNSSVSRKDNASSVYCDAAGRPLQSRWSVSTFASSAPPPSSSSSSRSFFPKLVTVPSRLSARLRAARERSLQHAREREEKEAAKPPVVLPYPFFPTPTPPSPKRKTNPGPGRYVPKPELMPPTPQKGKSEAERPKLASSVSAPVTMHTSVSGSPRSSCETVNTSSSSPKGKGKENSNTHFAAQFARYRAHRHSPAHAAHSAGASSYTSSPPRSVRSRTSSTDSLSAFPFTLGGERLSLSGSASGSDSGAETSTHARTQNGRCDSGLRRKPIPAEIFQRA